MDMENVTRDCVGGEDDEESFIVIARGDDDVPFEMDSSSRCLNFNQNLNTSESKLNESFHSMESSGSGDKNEAVADGAQYLEEDTVNAGGGGGGSARSSLSGGNGSSTTAVQTEETAMDTSSAESDLIPDSASSQNEDSSVQKLLQGYQLKIRALIEQNSALQTEIDHGREEMNGCLESISNMKDMIKALREETHELKRANEELKLSSPPVESAVVDGKLQETVGEQLEGGRDDGDSGIVNNVVTVQKRKIQELVELCAERSTQMEQLKETMHQMAIKEKEHATIVLKSEEQIAELLSKIEILKKEVEDVRADSRQEISGIHNEYRAELETVGNEKLVAMAAMKAEYEGQLGAVQEVLRAELSEKDSLTLQTQQFMEEVNELNNMYKLKCDELENLKKNISDNRNFAEGASGGGLQQSITAIPGKIYGFLTNNGDGFGPYPSMRRSMSGDSSSIQENGSFVHVPDVQKQQTNTASSSNDQAETPKLDLEPCPICLKRFETVKKLEFHASNCGFDMAERTDPFVFP